MTTSNDDYDGATSAEEAADADLKVPAPLLLSGRPGAKTGSRFRDPRSFTSKYSGPAGPEKNL